MSESPPGRGPARASSASGGQDLEKRLGRLRGARHVAECLTAEADRHRHALHKPELSQRLAATVRACGGSRCTTRAVLKALGASVAGRG